MFALTDLHKLCFPLSISLTKSKELKSEQNYKGGEVETLCKITKNLKCNPVNLIQDIAVIRDSNHLNL